MLRSGLNMQPNKAPTQENLLNQLATLSTVNPDLYKAYMGALVSADASAAAVVAPPAHAPPAAKRQKTAAAPVVPAPLPPPALPVAVAPAPMVVPVPVVADKPVVAPVKVVAGVLTIDSKKKKVPKKKEGRGGGGLTHFTKDQSNFLIAARIEMETHYKEAGNGNKLKKGDLWVQIRNQMTEHPTLSSLETPTAIQLENKWNNSVSAVKAWMDACAKSGMNAKKKPKVGEESQALVDYCASDLWPDLKLALYSKNTFVTPKKGAVHSHTHTLSHPYTLTPLHPQVKKGKLKLSPPPGLTLGSPLRRLSKGYKVLSKTPTGTVGRRMLSLRLTAP